MATKRVQTRIGEWESYRRLADTEGPHAEARFLEDGGGGAVADFPPLLRDLSAGC